jgi:L-aspartate oxidase
MRSVLDAQGHLAVLDRRGQTVIGGRPVGIPGSSPVPARQQGAPVDIATERDRLQRAMTTGAGVLRTAASLDETARVVHTVAARSFPGDDTGGRELQNLTSVALALVGAATSRRESRGAHCRSDYPETSASYRYRQVLRVARRGPDGPASQP